MEIKEIGVVGAGTMGASIAYLMAFNGYEVHLVDINDEMLNRGKMNIEKIMQSQLKFSNGRSEKEIEKIEKLGVKLTDEQKEQIRKTLKSSYTDEVVNLIAKRIHYSLKYDEMKKCQLIIEAAFENIDVKKEIIQKLGGIMDGKAILASNSSSLSVTQMSKFYRYPERFILTHFFNPPYTLPLVEIVRSMETSDETFEQTMSFFSALKNHRGPVKPISVKEVLGFLVNRILVPMINEAFFMLDERVASARDIDSAMKYGAGMPMGPLELADMVGIDVTYDVMKILYEEYADPKFRPSNLLKMYRNAGKLGRKTGKGVYSY